MDWDLKITDMAGATPEHSAVIVNFVAAIRYQLKNSTCYVYSDNVQYRFKDNQGNNKIVIPDASINCRTKSRRGNTFTDAPRFVMEVLSPSTENYDRTEKMQLYCEQEIEEYWIVDWRKRTVEIYELDYEGEIPKYYLLKTITEENKDELHLIHFPQIKITFDELFEEIDQWFITKAAANMLNQENQCPNVKIDLVGLQSYKPTRSIFTLNRVKTLILLGLHIW